MLLPSFLPFRVIYLIYEVWLTHLCLGKWTSMPSMDLLLILQRAGVSGDVWLQNFTQLSYGSSLIKEKRAIMEPCKTRCKRMTFRLD